ncbi:glucose-1-phosphate cytidylyltransferase [Acuticoccus sp. MNP-M23]|uniref:glucose-1-phosphate cytidylyltransferase n=1 Tax=Acuticoccus sp. MNP-M23 TaxID=3072793 RepID=UPI00281626F4|nr:glucose-1-phosphate cytidylyltransferase [Acuticoccus sp. MNP-M23]WMS43029.1 glucose-1-phosphate cytidylyltransferase [Acuticoccus sp. MNP-M23]
MKAVLLAGGLGTRISEETSVRPKPMVEIGGRPILWHIMKIYSHYGVNDFIICCGYKGYIIKEYFSNYFMHMSDVTFDMRSNEIIYHERRAEPWRVTLIDTGQLTMTGGRLRRVADAIGDEPFCFTYGDGVADVDVARQVAFHKAHGKLATVMAVTPPGRYGAMELGAKGSVRRFMEKPRGESGRINGGFFVLSPGVMDYIDDDSTAWEAEPMARLAAEGELVAYEHNGFWQPMDTLREKNRLDDLWNTDRAAWRVWDTKSAS